MTSPNRAKQVDAILEERRAEFVDALRAVLVDRRFPPHPRFRGELPAIDASDELCAIRLIFDVQEFEPVACGMSRRGAWKFGARPLLGGGDCVGDLVWRVEFDSLEEQRALASVADQKFREWVFAGWRAVRGVAPDLAGYLSPEDTQFVTDLDTGSKLSLNALGLNYR